MNRHLRKAGSAAYNRIPNPNAAQEALGIAALIPLLAVTLFALSAFGIL